MTEDESTMSHSEKLSAILVSSLLVMAFIVTYSPSILAGVFTGTTTAVTQCQTDTTTSSGSTTTITTVGVVCSTFTDQFTVGYVGCSDTWMTIQGYYMQPNAGLFWDADSAYSGGGIDNSGWANASTHYWTTYDQEVSVYGQPKAVWVEDCGSGVDGTAADDATVWSLIQQFFVILKEKSPSATVYMSSINDFLPNGTCPRTGLTDVPQTERMTRLAVADGLALAGPIMGPLVLNGTLDSSRCHPNTAGELLLGSQLVQFFDGLTLSSSNVSCSRSSVVVGSAITCKATVHESGTKAPTGKVTWSSSGSGTFVKASCRLSKHNSYSACSVRYTPTAPGSVIITASYGGDSNNPASAGAYNLVVSMRATKTTVTCSPESVVAGSSKKITCKALVKGYLPTGTVTWTQSGTGSVTLSSTTCTLTRYGPSLTTRTCSVKMTGATAGTVTLQTAYSGDPSNLGSYRTAALTIKP